MTIIHFYGSNEASSQLGNAITSCARSCFGENFVETIVQSNALIG